MQLNASKCPEASRHTEVLDELYKHNKKKPKVPTLTMPMLKFYASLYTE